ncbi:MAG: ribosome small subunit-dependent GTPase A [Candidatus Dormibacteraeota bacterium]|nr:ribosome small subunit-dependent GTPase A [Candidatus Dormibacteraeota bacterium]
MSSQNAPCARPAYFNAQLAALGWDSYFDEKFKRFASDGGVAARVIADFGSEYLVHDGAGTRRAAVGRHLRNDGSTMPAVGDWVSVLKREPVDAIHGVVERRTLFSRKAASVETRQQVLAANVDVAFVVAAATDVNARRIERYLTIAWQSGAVPVVLLTKADIAVSLEELRVELEAVSMGTPVVVTSGVTGDGIDEIVRELQPARTGVLLGPSGAGKSTLINRIVGTDLMRTRAIHSSGEGRHMTSHRQLVPLPQGGMIIDTPGLREAQLWEGDEALASVFEDIEELALQCRFRDCIHETEPGCAIKEALGTGKLDAARFQSYVKLLRELRFVASKSDVRLRIEERKKWKQIGQEAKIRSRP